MTNILEYKFGKKLDEERNQMLQLLVHVKEFTTDKDTAEYVEERLEEILTGNAGSIPAR